MIETPRVVSPPSIDISHYANTILDFFSTNYPTFFDIASHIIGFLIGLSIPISVLLFFAIIVVVEKSKALKRREDEKYNAKVEIAYDKVDKADENTPAHKWDVAMAHIESENHNDWRQAVIEADILLEDMLLDLGYKGDSVGEQLNRVDKADFKTLEHAWEAHKVRNNIAHAGSGFEFTQHEARRVMNLYKQVFEEFYYLR